MIQFENTQTHGWEAAIRGMRNPMNSWEKSDIGVECTMDRLGDCLNTEYLACDKCHGFKIGPDDLKLMHKLAAAGTDHGKFLRMITVTVDITAPIYWWKEYDTYKVGTVTNSCSTMHKIHAKEFTLEDFSHEYLGEPAVRLLLKTIKLMNAYRKCFINYDEPHDPPHKLPKKVYWWQMIQLLPSSYNQRRTVQLNYAVLRNIYAARSTHKLDEWRDFCRWAEGMPYARDLILPDGRCAHGLEGNAMGEWR